MGQITNLIATINGSSLSPAGIKISLIAKLQAALAALQAGDIATACSDLQDFTNEVNAQKGKKVPADLADALLSSVTEIRNQLGCAEAVSNLPAQSGGTFSIIKLVLTNLMTYIVTDPLQI